MSKIFLFFLIILCAIYYVSAETSHEKTDLEKINDITYTVAIFSGIAFAIAMVLCGLIGLPDNIPWIIIVIGFFILESICIFVNAFYAILWTPILFLGVTLCTMFISLIIVGIGMVVIKLVKIVL